MRLIFNKSLYYIVSAIIAVLIGLYFYTSVAAFIAKAHNLYGLAIMCLIIFLAIVVYGIISEVMAKNEKNFMACFLPLIGVCALFVVMAGEYASTPVFDRIEITATYALFSLSIIGAACEVVGYLIVLFSHLNISKLNYKTSLVVTKSLNTVACALLVVFGVLAIIGGISIGNIISIILACTYILAGIFSCIAVWIVTASKFGIKNNTHKMPANKFVRKSIDPTIKETLLSKQHPSIQDIEYAKRLLDKQEITAEEFEEYKTKYINNK